jgi:hypothetical protein
VMDHLNNAIDAKNNLRHELINYIIIKKFSGIFVKKDLIRKVGNAAAECFLQQDYLLGLLFLMQSER